MCIRDRNVGDIVTLVSAQQGTSATGRVESISTTTTGKIDFELVDGGFGYTADAGSSKSNDVLISNQVLILQTDLSSTINIGDHLVAEAGATYTINPLTGAIGSGTGTVSGG